MPKGIFFVLVFFGFFSSIVHAQTAPPVDVTVTNTPEVKVINKVQIEQEEEIPLVEAPIIEDALTMQTMLQPLFDWKDSCRQLVYFSIFFSQV
jgi:hypothetical protein